MISRIILGIVAIFLIDVCLGAAVSFYQSVYMPGATRGTILTQASVAIGAGIIGYFMLCFALGGLFRPQRNRRSGRRRQ